MNIFFLIKAVILGIVEGLTEFLPVSSTGHLIIFSHLIDFYDGSSKIFVDMFNMVIQLGAILAVIVLYWEKILHTLIHLLPSKNSDFKDSGFYFWLMIAISCVPAAIVGLSLDDIVKMHLFNPITVACALFFGGLWMAIAEKKLRSNKPISLLHITITPRQAIIIGCFQVLSIIPGVSRSAATIIGGWSVGLSTIAATEYSFFLSLPVMFGQAAINLLKVQNTLMPIEWVALGIGFVVAFMVALIVIQAFLNFLKTKPIRYFAIYRIIFAFFVLGYSLLM